MKYCFFFLLFALSQLLFAQTKHQLIIFKIINTNPIEQENLDRLHTSIETSLSSFGYGIINETIQNEALNEQKKQQNSDCYDDQCLVDTGRMLAAKKLLIIRIQKQDDLNYFIKLRKIDIETGIIENSSAFSEYLDFSRYNDMNHTVKKRLSYLFKQRIKYKQQGNVQFKAPQVKTPKEELFIGNLEWMNEYKLLIDLDDTADTHHFHTGVMLSLLTLKIEQFKIDFIRAGFLTDFKSKNDYKNIKFSFINMEFQSQTNMFYALTLGYMLGDGDFIIHSDTILLFPLGFKIGYRYPFFNELFTLKLYQKTDWVIHGTSKSSANHGVGLTFGASLEYLFK